MAEMCWQLPCFDRPGDLGDPGLDWSYIYFITCVETGSPKKSNMRMSHWKFSNPELSHPKSSNWVTSWKESEVATIFSALCLYFILYFVLCLAWKVTEKMTIGRLDGPNSSCTIGRYPIGSMGLEYLPTFTIKNQPNVGKYTIHGAYGYVIFLTNS